MSVIPKPYRLVPGEGRFSLADAAFIQVSPEAGAMGEILRHSLPFPSGARCGMRLTDSPVSPASESGFQLLIDSASEGETLGPEGYHLTISPAGVALRASQPAGLFYGVQTLRQLLTPAGDLPALEISDRPRFPWRGLMLDVGRHFFPLDFIRRLIDAMALHKFNRLHWHLTDDQGWRIEIKRYPRLTEVGAYRAATPILADRSTLDGRPYGGYYTQAQIKDLVAYAASRFITIVPEIEMPGHSVAALAAYPELGCTGGPYQPRVWWGVEDDVYCAGNEQVFTFLENVLDEVLALFPSQFIHIGGDECPKTRWQACPKCQQAILQQGLKDEHELQSAFVRRIEAYLNRQGRRLIGWDEILEGGLAPNASVMSWRGMEGGLQAARLGHDVVMTPTEFCYFDYYQSDDYAHEPPAIGGLVPLEKVYAFEPAPPALTPAEAQHILGVQGNLWSEYISTPEHAEYMLFPRAAAMAEVAWSPPAGRSFADFQPRLPAFLALLKQMGVNIRSG